MLKEVQNLVWAFDAEWVPDPQCGRVDLEGRLPHAEVSELSDEEIADLMYSDERSKRDTRGQGTLEKRPYLNTSQCRLVSVSIVSRLVVGKTDTVSLALKSVPAIGSDGSIEEDVVDGFLRSLGDKHPQLVGWNSSAADLPIFIRRAMRHGLSYPKLQRPDKPWFGTDYFDTRNSNAHVDLKNCVGPPGFGSPSLDEMARCLHIPGKGEVEGADVLDLWREGKVDEIVAYNERDAVTTYLVWLRVCLLMGFFDPAQHAAEETLVQDMLLGRDQVHTRHYLEEWTPLKDRL